MAKLTYEEYTQLCRECVALSASYAGMTVSFDPVEDFKREVKGLAEAPGKESVEFPFYLESQSANDVPLVVAQVARHLLGVSISQVVKEIEEGFARKRRPPGL